ncbi:MAG: threonine synthase [Clostridiales bacterium]|nr:threonine synthase [Clostridiales bacterium]
MSFFSTRGGAAVTASQAILYGLAKDGGLYVPAMFPPISLQKIASLTGMDYCQRASTILRTYLEDYTIPEIDAALAAAYDKAKFDDPAIAPMKRLDEGTWVLELFHGPTLAFKDMALQLLPHLTTLAARKNGETREVSILVATSGDTGKAALEGFKDVPGTSCTVFYPSDGVSDVQKLQMTTTGGSNTHVIGIQGNFDDAQTGVKALFSSAEFAGQMDKMGKVLSSANSINFGRLVPQIVYYFSAYADLLNAGAIKLGEEVNFVVPTGNFGNILAAYYARNMGLPVKRLICASNRNNVLTDFFRNGVYDTRRTFFKTTSPSMDILISSNLERLLYECADRDGELVARWMKQLKECYTYAIGEQRQEWMNDVFDAGYCDDMQCADEIRARFEQDHYLMDTHTAVASHVLREYREKTGDLTPAVVVSTASPYKFAADVLSAVAGSDAANGLDAFECSEKLEQLSGVQIPQQVKALRSLPVRHRQQCQKDQMAAAVLEAFGK